MKQKYKKINKMQEIEHNKLFLDSRIKMPRF
jgi:hypothetical protein